MQFIDLQAQYRALKTEIDSNIRDVLDTAQYIGGPFIRELEERLAAFAGRRYCITCANGTDALQAAFMALGGCGILFGCYVCCIHRACVYAGGNAGFLRH